MIYKLGDFIKKKIDRKVKGTNQKKSDIIKSLGITNQYLHDMENGKRVPSSNLMKSMITVLDLSEQEQIELYDLASESHKIKKVPADIEEYIIENKEAKDEIRKLTDEELDNPKIWEAVRRSMTMTQK